MRYRHIVEHIEVLCDAAGLTDEKYLEKIKEFKDSEVFKKESEDFVKGAMLSREKLRLMMGMVFKNKTITSSLKY